MRTSCISSIFAISITRLENHLGCHAHKFGWKAGLLTAVCSPEALVNVCKDLGIKAPGRVAVRISRPASLLSTAIR